MLTELNSTDRMMFYKDNRRQQFLYVVFVSILLPLQQTQCITNSSVNKAWACLCRIDW